MRIQPPRTPGHDRSQAQLGAGRLVAARAGGRLDEQPDRRVLGLEVVVVEQAAEGALPGGAGRRGRAADRAVDHRLPARASAATATACLQSPPTGQEQVLAQRRSSRRPDARRRDGGERDGGGVGLAVAAADPAGGVGAVVAQLELDDPALLGVGEAAGDGHGAADLVELAVGEVGEAVDGEHTTHHTTSAPPAPGPARPNPEHPTVCRAADIPVMSSTPPAPRTPRTATSCDLRTVSPGIRTVRPCPSRTKVGV